MKKKILFIINPISGVGGQKKIERLIDGMLDRNQFDYELAYTKASKHATELSRQGVKESFDTVVAVGGDGSVNEVGRGLVGTDSALAVLPCGSGNGAARHLRVPMDLRKAMEVINRNKTGRIDTFTVNDEIAINTAGIGFAAHIAHEFSKFKKRGFSNYLKIAVRDSMKYRSQLCEIQITSPPNPSPAGEGSIPECGIIRLSAFIIDVANGTQWGNNAVIAPGAKNDDGILNLCVVRDFAYIHFPVLASRLFTGSIHRSKFVEIHPFREATLIQENSIAHIDGEPYNMGNELKIKVRPLSLKVVQP